MSKMSEKEILAATAEERRQRAELDLLIDDNDAGKTASKADIGKRDLRFVRE